MPRQPVHQPCMLPWRPCTELSPRFIAGTIHGVVRQISFGLLIRLPSGSGGFLCKAVFFILPVTPCPGLPG